MSLGSVAAWLECSRVALNAGTRKVNVSVATGAAGLPWCCAFFGVWDVGVSMLSVTVAAAGLLLKASTHGDSGQKKEISI